MLHNFMKNIASIFVLSLFANGQLQAAEALPDHEAHLTSHKNMVTTLSELPQDICNIIFDLHLLLTGQVFPPMYKETKEFTEIEFTEKVESYLENKIGYVLEQSGNSLCSLQRNALIIAQSVKTDETVKNAFFRHIDDKLFFMAPFGLSLIPTLQRQYVKLEENDLIQSENIEIAKQLYKALFDSDLPTENEESTKTGLNHLLAAWSLHGVYFPKDFKEKSMQKFFQQCSDKLIKNLKILSTSEPCLSFGLQPADFNKMKSQTYNIVVTDQQFINPELKESLLDLLKSNPNHMVTLSIGNDYFIEEGRLLYFRLFESRISAKKPPQRLYVDFVKHLRIANSRNNISTIPNLFLLEANLRTFDSSGLECVTRIMRNCFVACPELTSVDYSGFINVTKVDTCFLMDSKKISGEDKIKMNEFLSSRRG